jgi:hypothetical protein
MKSIAVAAWVFLLVIAANRCSAQFGRPIPIPRPVPVHVPHVPHVPGGHEPGRRSEDGDFGGVMAVLTLLGGGYLGYRLWKKRPSVMRIRITDTPPGEAPVAIRRAWIGLELPLEGETTARPMAVVGVLSDEAAATTGYAVRGRTAVRLLDSHAPAAADWWRENAAHVMDNGYQLVFPADVCERIR